jgi:hypothetical protein
MCNRRKLIASEKRRVRRRKEEKKTLRKRVAAFHVTLASRWQQDELATGSGARGSRIWEDANA